MSDYLKSVVQARSPQPASGGFEGQAIAARTYAYYHIFNEQKQGNI
jgi:peptidoglycan hydrolase-like amidase